MTHAPLHGRNRSGASVTMSVTSWSDALTGQQCGLYDNNVQAFETTCPADAAEGFAHSASLDPTAMERAGLRVKKEEGVACPPWWLPLFMGDHDPVRSGSHVTHGVVVPKMTPVSRAATEAAVSKAGPNNCDDLEDKKPCKKEK